MNQVRYRKLVLIYALVGSLWVVGSDWLLSRLIGDFDLSFDFSVAKGVGFVLVMSALLYFLLRRLSVVESKALASESPEQLFLSRIPQFFQSIPVVTYAVEMRDRQVRPLWVSENVTSLLGYSVSEMLSPGWWENVLHPDDRLRALEASKDILSRGGGDHYYRIQHANGTYLHIHDELRAVDDNQPRRFVGVWHDISSEQQAQQQIQDYSTRLEKTILGTVSCIASMVEMRDPYTSGHESRVGDLAVRIAEEMGLDMDTQYGLRVAGLVHDIGKISIPSEYLTKPTRLSEHEYRILQTHPENGYNILKNVDFPWPIADVARQHHERMDGSGYPQGLKGEDILLEARIIAVADVIESMATARPYRHALGIDKALAEIEQNTGRLYDPEVAAAALKLFRDKGLELATHA